MSPERVLLWVGFNVFILVMLALDLLLVKRRDSEIKFKQALLWSGVWIALAFVFNAGILVWMGRQSALEFLAGYLIEKSLSVDNLFIFILIFSYFKIPAKYQHKVLFWGILGALVMRAVFIFGGIALLKLFHPVIYVFGAFLIFTGAKMAFGKDKDIDPEKIPVVKLFRAFFPTTKMHEEKFFVLEAGRWLATPLFIVLLIIESTDLIFAVDSIPAVLAVTQDPFIVYSSNIFAVLGLRALYFVLAGTMHLFKYLHLGLSGVLIFVGIKMLFSDILKIPIVLSLLVIVFLLGISIIASLRSCENKSIS